MPKKALGLRDAKKTIRAEIRKEKLDAYVETVDDTEDPRVKSIEVSFPAESDEDLADLGVFEDKVLPRLEKTLEGWKYSGEGFGAGSAEYYFHPKEGHP